MNKITKLKIAELSAVNGGKGCMAITWAITVSLVPYALHMTVVLSQNYIEMKKILAQKGSGDNKSWHAMNPTPSKTKQFIKKTTNALLFWKGSKDRFGCFEDGRFL